METQKVINLLNVSDNENSQLQQKNGILLIAYQKVVIHMKMKSNFKQVH